MRLYLDEDFKPEYLSRVTAIQSEEYYVNMMIAWYLATALAKQWDSTIPYLENHLLSDRVHKKTIRKAIESYRITEEQKRYLEKAALEINAAFTVFSYRLYILYRFTNKIQSSFSIPSLSV